MASTIAHDGPRYQCPYRRLIPITDNFPNVAHTGTTERLPCEVVRPGERAATYGVGPRKMIDGYAYILPHARWVNLGFNQGADLPDPETRLEGSGARMRHVKVRSPQDANDPAVRALLESALAERLNAVGR